MSIQRTLADAIVARRLFRYGPAYADPDFVERRLILMSPEAMQQCPPSGRSSERKLKDTVLTNIRAQLEAFIAGEEMVEDEDLKRLLPASREIWELRVLEFPQTRLFGWFVYPDAMLISHCELRDRLKDGSNPAWEKAMAKCERKRTEFYSDLPTFASHKFEDYITYKGVSKHG